MTETTTEYALWCEAVDDVTPLSGPYDARACQFQCGDEMAHVRLRRIVTEWTPIASEARS